MVNFHVHSASSDDCQYSMEAMLESAIDAGIKHICFTDHYDVNFPTTPEYNIETAIHTFNKLHKIFSHKIYLYLGIELGQPSENHEESLRLISNENIDYVLGALHNLPDGEDFYFMDYANVELDEMFNAYFDELINLCETYDIDTLAHICYPIRYLKRNRCQYDLNRYANKIEQLLKLLIKKEIALEINTSGIKTALKDTLPPRSILEKYYNLGGRLITIGTDAHRPVNIATGLAESYQIAKEIGFKQIVIFKKRQKIFINLDI